MRAYELVEDFMSIVSVDKWSGRLRMGDEKAQSNDGSLEARTGTGTL
jgi:hypothetical protein